MKRPDLGRVRPTYLAAGAALASAGFVAGLLVGLPSAQSVPVAATAQEKSAAATVPTSTPTVPPWEVSQPSALPLPEPLAGIAPGSAAPVADELAASGIPAVALRAYQQAADRLAQLAPGCGLHWSLVAAIGRVETDHGRFGGSQLRTDGTTTIPIRGPQLNGGAFAVITDTDRGELDGDTAYDRAVGPMQFIPSTWRSVAADGNGDGRSDPDNIFDAATGTGVLLCSGGANLSDVSGMRAAALRYNHSDEYADLVLSLAGSYRGSVITIPDDAGAAAAPTAGAAAGTTGTAGTSASSGEPASSAAAPAADGSAAASTTVTTVAPDVPIGTTTVQAPPAVTSTTTTAVGAPSTAPVTVAPTSPPPAVVESTEPAPTTTSDPGLLGVVIGLL
ncbi:lytic murein transglycosylase [Umezawaea sp. Da 62-37]|uniref:lytic transglycosylase domain-containing protein n=1 Tax=Umezawaea sp. Da 62-37 TaxID=3075927 RepID=UPI0028F700F1|nr:lytic murein transglycosylase [Umezawaea sp. Da 62-37]WNV87986.1 lytic murein transglycosylase [Umezawaea sp. Da 62-37]